MLRIAVIMGKMDSGGKKSLVMEYYRHMDRDQVQYDFICDSDSNSIPYEEIQSLGGRVYIVRPYSRIIGNMRDIGKLCRENNYRIMHAFNSTMNVFPMFVAKVNGVPVRISESISMAHKGDWRTGIKVLLRPLSKLFTTNYMSNGTDCGRWQFGDKLYDSGKVDVFRTVIDTEYNAFDAEVRNRTRRDYGWENSLIVGHIGRLAPQKNTLRVIEIFSAIAKKDPSARLCLIGDGELKEKMLAKIHELSLEKRVDYLGRREDIQLFYNAMDVFLLPSLYEGLPVVGLEAESCGLPVFFSTEITDEANACELGHFIDLADSDEIWAEKILRQTYSNLNKRRSHAAELASAGYDSAYEAARLTNFYLNIAAVFRDGVK